MSPEDLKGGVLWDYHDAGKRSYLQTNYESSPLNRITEQYGVGDAWGDHPARMEYRRIFRLIHCVVRSIL